MSTDVVSITSLNGTIENPRLTRLPRLCHLFEFETDAEQEFQSRSMAAAAEVYDWYYKPKIWQGELRKLWDAEAKETGFDPRWKWNSDRGFRRWVGMEVSKAGVIYRRSQVERLFNAEAMRRVVLELSPRGDTPIPLPETEKAWRPAIRLYGKGFKAEIVDAVRRAGEIAGDRGEPISHGIMTKAVAEVWRTAPRIQDWVGQPNKPKGDETDRDTSVRMMQTEQRHLEKFLRIGRPQENKRLRDWYVGEVDAL